MTLPALPAQGSTAWYSYAQGLDTAARGASVVTATGGDQTARVNAVLAASSPFGARRQVTLVGDFTISGPLVIGSGTILDARAATITLIAGSYERMLRNAADVAGTGRDTDIAVIGGRWVRAAGNFNSDGQHLHSIFLRKVDGVLVCDLRGETSDGKYMIALGDVTDFRVERISLATSSDGVHLTGPASNGYIGKISGTVGDDLVGVTTQDYSAYDDVRGPISRVTFDRLDCTPRSGSVPHTLALWGAGGYPLTDITARGITAQNNGSGLPLAVVLGGTTQAINLDGVAGNINVTYQQGAGWNGVGAHNRVSIRNVRYIPGASLTSAVQVAGDASGTYACTVDQLIVDGVRADGQGTRTFPALDVSASAVVNRLSLVDCALVGSSGAALLYCWGTNSRIKQAHLTRCYRDGVDYSSGRVVNVDTGGRIDSLFLAQVVAEHCQWAVNISGSGGMAVYVAGCDLSDAINSVRAADGIAITLRSAASNLATNTTIAGGTITNA